MALTVQGLTRVFKHEGKTLDDPNSDFSVDEVMGFYSVRYPELTTATIHGPEVEGDKAVYEFKTVVGTKG